MTVTAAVHPASDTISDVALDTTSDTVPAPTAPDENNLTDTVNKTTDDAIAEAEKACEDMQAAQESQNAGFRECRCTAKAAGKRYLL